MSSLQPAGDGNYPLTVGCDHYHRRVDSSRRFSHSNKKPLLFRQGSVSCVGLFSLLVEMLLVPAFEFIHPSCGVNQFHFTGKERMGGV